MCTVAGTPTRPERVGGVFCRTVTGMAKETVKQGEVHYVSKIIGSQGYCTSGSGSNWFRNYMLYFTLYGNENRYDQRCRET